VKAILSESYASAALYIASTGI